MSNIYIISYIIPEKLQTNSTLAENELFMQKTDILFSQSYIKNTHDHIRKSIMRI